MMSFSARITELYHTQALGDSYGTYRPRSTHCSLIFSAPRAPLVSLIGSFVQTRHVHLTTPKHRCSSSKDSDPRPSSGDSVNPNRNQSRALLPQPRYLLPQLKSEGAATVTRPPSRVIPEYNPETASAARLNARKIIPTVPVNYEIPHYMSEDGAEVPRPCRSHIKDLFGRRKGLIRG